MLLFLTGVSPLLAQQTPFDRLIDRFRNGQIFESGFNHVYVDSYTGDTVKTSGTIWVGDDEYKVRNSKQTVVVDGTYSRVYDDNRNRVIISKYEPEEDDFAPSRFLNGADSTYVVEEQRKSGNNMLITLRSEDPFAIFKQVEITLDPNLTPLKIFAKDQADNLITTTFGSGTFKQRQAGLFVLEFPDSAEVIDMRN